MPKPKTIDRNLIHGKDKEEKYKDATKLDYWWGLKELAADFDVDNYETASGDKLNDDQQKEVAYIQLLHYTVYVKLSGAFYQMEQMEKVLGPSGPGDRSLDLMVFEGKEAFDALHTDLYEAFCALVNQLYMLLNRGYYEPIKMDHKKQSPMTLSDLRYWLRLNKHPDYKVLNSVLHACDRHLDIRHHATHYGAVPVYASMKSRDLYIQHGFRIGDFLTKYDIVSYMMKGGKMESLLDVSRPRATGLCSDVNEIYRYIYSRDIFEGYMKDRGLKIKDTYKPYWER